MKRKKKKHSNAIEQLTKQEQNVLDLLLTDNTNKAIAETLFVSVSTVKTHVNNIYKKLNVNSRDELKSLFNK
nr:LuxR C-terminal-related transcriptional regulator [Psychroserpens algicola]